MTETDAGSTTRTLVLVRHAKAEGSAHTDHARELSARGRADAGAMGRWLVGAEHKFDIAVISSAVRTRQTWREIAAAGVSACGVRINDRVYGADAEELLDVLAGIDDEVSSILVVGHAPTIPELADQLADPDTSDPDALAALHTAFPTSCLAVLRVDEAWSALSPGRAELTEVIASRG